MTLSQPTLPVCPCPENPAGTSSGFPTLTICQVLHTLHVGGAEVLAARLARGLRDNFRFIFVCLDELGTLGEHLQDEGFPVYVLQRRPGFDYRCIFRLAKILRAEQVDIVQAHQYTPFFYAITARLLCCRPAVVFTEHGRHHPDYPRRKRIWFNRLMLRRRDRVVAVGAAVRQALIANEGITPSRIEVIYNGIDLKPVALHPTRSEVRRELGIDAEDLVIIQVARLDYLKDHATALRTMARVIREHPTAHLILVGEGPERGVIESQIRQAGLMSHVHLLGLRQDVARLLAAADLFLLTSISEGIPLTLIEAMAAGLPVVATNVGGVGEVVAEGMTGFLARPGDDQLLARHVIQLSTDFGLRIRFGEEGRQVTSQKFTEERMGNQYTLLYKDFMHAKK